MDNLVALAARDDLLAIVAAWPALQARLEPSGSSTGGASHPAPGSRPPIDLHVSDLMHEIETEARALGRILLEETDDWQPDTSEMPGLLRSVALRFGHFTHGDDEKTAYDFLDIAHEFRRKVALALERPEPARWMGPCIVPECDGELRLFGHRVDTTCPECGNVAGLLEVRKHLHAALKDRLMTRGELVSALFVLGIEVKPKTLDKWVERGRLEKAVEDPDLYRLEDALRLAERGKVAA
ncbi:hypothetical protein ABRQ22_17310 [Cellulosimicrobium sp. ES-005]|uniref:Uncharacterized protein n=1 Tax=Cellulosimicrobium sp. ES-005 TaxID=3163031 RepID=A0AAU8FZH5_9MICO